MSQQARIVKPAADDIPREILDLAAAIEQLPAEHAGGSSPCWPA